MQYVYLTHTQEANMGDKYVVKQEMDIWGNDQTVVRRAVSGADVVNGLAGGIAFLAARNQDAKWKEAMDKLALCEKYADAGEFDNALRLAQQVTAISGKQYQLLGHASVARIFTEYKKTYAEAIPEWNETIRLASDLEVSQLESVSYKWRGVCYYNTKQIAEALRDFAKYSQLQPNDFDGPAWLGMALIELGDLPQAIAKLSQAISLAPGEDWLYRERAYAYTQMGDKQTALADMNKAIVLSPSTARYYYRRAELYADLGNMDAAVSDYTKSIELNPGDVEALQARAKLYEQRGDTEHQIADIAQIEKERPIQDKYKHYLEVADTLYKNGYSHEYSQLDTQPHPNTGRIALNMGILLTIAAVTWWIVAHWNWRPQDSTSQTCFYILIIAIIGFALYQPKMWIDAAKAAALKASEYRDRINSREAKLPGFEKFYTLYLSAKRNNKEQDLPIATREIITAERNPRVRHVSFKE